jgi:hypothetical protein
MNINFTRPEMAEFLRRNGYEVSFKTLRQQRHFDENNYYCPDSYTVEISFYSIKKDNKEYMSHLLDFNKPYQWLEMIFEEEMKNKLLNL